jgi:hypothetical protein
MTNEPGNNFLFRIRPMPGSGFVHAYMHARSGHQMKLQLEHLHRRLQNGGRQDAGRVVLGALAGPSKILGPDSHTGGPKTPAPTKFEILYLPNFH